jgi:5'-nucleotidase
MPFDLSRVLVVGISSRALFDLGESNLVFEREGLDAYTRHQLSREEDVLAPGAAFPLISAMLRLNEATAVGGRRCEVVVMSKNNAATSLRLWRSIQHHRLDITRGAFVSGAPLADYLDAFKVDLFLSLNEPDVQAAVDAGFAAALVYPPPDGYTARLGQIRIAFDADAVIFSDESERIYQEQGLAAFLEHERQNARQPLKEGPFAKLLRAIAVLQRDVRPDVIRTAIVTARNWPAHERVIRTLEVWGVRVDEAFFLGGIAKDKVLKAFGAHIFFDDQHAHVEPASRLVPAARVPYKINLTLPVVAEMERHAGALAQAEHGVRGLTLSTARDGDTIAHEDGAASVDAGTITPKTSGAV